MIFWGTNGAQVSEPKENASLEPLAHKDYYLKSVQLMSDGNTTARTITEVEYLELNEFSVG